MKVAILSESSADEAAIRIWVDAILGFKTTTVILDKRIRLHRGWPGVREDLSFVVRHLHYHTDADVLVVVVDSDSSLPHDQSHLSAMANCRLCELRGKIRQIQSILKAVPGLRSMRVAIGLAVPAIEAWLQCDRDTHISETTWKQILARRSKRYSKQILKSNLYGTDRPTLNRETEVMVERAIALAANLRLLESRFPGGFLPLANALRQP
jgi:hypothetical protein